MNIEYFEANGATRSARVGSLSLIIINAPRVWVKTTDGSPTVEWMDMLTGKTNSEKPTTTETFWYALLAVPKHDPNDTPSINKYSPTVAKGETLEELKLGIASWADANQHKTAWELRTG